MPQTKFKVGDRVFRSKVTSGDTRGSFKKDDEAFVVKIQGNNAVVTNDKIKETGMNGGEGYYLYTSELTLSTKLHRALK